MMLSERVHHFAVAVSDLERAVSWYAEKLDFVVEKRFTLEDAQLRIVKMRSPGGMGLELLHSLRPSEGARPGGGVLDPGVKHVCFEVDDIVNAAEEARSRGIRIVQEPKVIEESREKNCWIVDVEGNMIEFIEEMDGKP